jgi:molybdopterin-guanine dinucleotide biosynthesis protein B
VCYPDDDFIAAIATDMPERLPQATALDVLDLNDVHAVADWLIRHAERFQYSAEMYG